MGSLFKSPKAPAPINVAAVGQQQEQANTKAVQQGAAYNRVNQFGPFGSTTYAQTGTDANGNPIFAQNTSLDPNELAYRDQQRGAAFGAYSGGLERLGNVGLNRVGTDPTGLMSGGVDRLSPFMSGSGPDTSTDAALNRAYDAATSFSAPRQAREMAGLETQLANQGFARGSEAWNNAARDMTERQSASNNTLMAGLQNQMFAQGMQNRQQQFGEGQALFGMGANEAGRLFGQDQAIAGLDAQTAQGIGSLGRSGMVDAMTQTGAPGYTSVATPNAVDYTGLAAANYQQQQNAYNQQVQQRNAMLGGLAGIGGSILAAPIGGGMSVGGSLFNRMF
jgi:hypothetical protein